MPIIAIKYCPISYVGELNGIHYYFCEKCDPADGTFDMVGDERMHDLGTGCADCPDPLLSGSAHTLNVIFRGLDFNIAEADDILDRRSRFLRAGAHVKVEEGESLKFSFVGHGGGNRKVNARTWKVDVYVPDPADDTRTRKHTFRIGHQFAENFGGPGNGNHDPAASKSHHHKVTKGADEYQVLTVRGNRLA